MKHWRRIAASDAMVSGRNASGNGHGLSLPSLRNQQGYPHSAQTERGAGPSHSSP